MEERNTWFFPVYANHESDLCDRVMISHVPWKKLVYLTLTVKGTWFCYFFINQSIKCTKKVLSSPASPWFFYLTIINFESNLFAVFERLKVHFFSCLELGAFLTPFLNGLIFFSGLGNKIIVCWSSKGSSLTTNSSIVDWPQCKMKAFICYKG